MLYSKETLKKIAKYTGKETEFWENTFAKFNNEYGLVSPGDKNYPFLVDKNGNEIKPEYTTKRDEYKTQVPNRRGAPHFLFYRGDISLLNKGNFTKNVAVIGVLNPTNDIIEREKLLVKEIVKHGGNIVSGLALGCDSIAHKECIANGGKTIAVLPSRLDNILPKENSQLADEIVLSGGLLVTEYYNEPIERFELSARYIERDRLQAYFSNAVVLIASYRHPEKNDLQYPQDGIKRDSGSRHAMKAAEKIGRKRYALYDDKTDSANEMFDLNRDLIRDRKNPAKIATDSSIKEMVSDKMPGFLPIFGMSAINTLVQEQ